MDAVRKHAWSSWIHWWAARVEEVTEPRTLNEQTQIIHRSWIQLVSIRRNEWTKAVTSGTSRSQRIPLPQTGLRGLGLSSSTKSCVKGLNSSYIKYAITQLLCGITASKIWIMRMYAWLRAREKALCGFVKIPIKVSICLGFLLPLAHNRKPPLISFIKCLLNKKLKVIHIKKEENK